MWTKVVGQALLPLNVAIEAALLALVLRRFGRRRLAAAAFGLGLGVLWLASTPVLSEALVAAVESRNPPVPMDAVPAADAIVVLGGAIGPARPPRLAADLSDGADRVLHAARLFRAGKAPLVIVSGGAGPVGGDDAPESRDVADLLVEWGVPRGAVVEEASALDTRGNAVETKRLLDARGAKRVLLVTSALHMPRAAAAFRAAGVEVIPAPTDFLAVTPARRTLLDFLPDATALEHSTAVVHEGIGALWYALHGWE